MIDCLSVLPVPEFPPTGESIAIACAEAKASIEKSETIGYPENKLNHGKT
jgi:hypothetical protein